MKILKRIIINLCLIIGVFLIVYPIYSKVVLNVNQTSVINNYNNKISLMEDENIKQFEKNAEEFNNKLYEDNSFDSSLTQNSVSQIDLSGNEILGYIIIPKLDIELPIYEGCSSNILSLGIGHLSNTSLPIGGINTHSVLVRSYWTF